VAGFLDSECTILNANADHFRLDGLQMLSSLLQASLDFHQSLHGDSLPFMRRELEVEYIAEGQEIQIDREQEEMQIQFRPPSHRRPVYNYRLPDDCYAIISEDSTSARIAYAVIVLFNWRMFVSIVPARWYILVLLLAAWLVFHLSSHAGRYADLEWRVPKSPFGEGGERLL